jgi:DNA topoisomerase IA
MDKHQVQAQALRTNIDILTGMENSRLMTRPKPNTSIDMQPQTMALGCLEVGLTVSSAMYSAESRPV